MDTPESEAGEDRSILQYAFRVRIGVNRCPLSPQQQQISLTHDLEASRELDAGA
jgi:hypothetical protein